ncbi:MAG: type II toxin-antitoxin system VapB family antitoxin [Actinomycetota bacterium]
MGRKVRTNIVIDEELVAEVMRTYALRSKRAAVEFALRSVLGRHEPVDDPWKAMLELQGIWSDMTDEEAFAIYDPDAEPDTEQS